VPWCVCARARIAKGERVWWLVAGEEASSVVMTRAEILNHPQSATLQTYSYMIGEEPEKKKKNAFFSIVFRVADCRFAFSTLFCCRFDRCSLCAYVRHVDSSSF
jgi:hypothetical protein